VTNAIDASSATLSFDEPAPRDERRDRRLEAGLPAGIGMQYALSACIFYLERRFYYGLTDMQKTYSLQMTPRINDALTLHAGVLFDANLPAVFKGKKKR
jgi:hypothetical protein